MALLISGVTFWPSVPSGGGGGGGGGEVSMLTHTYGTHTNPWGRLMWPYAITRLTAHFMCGLTSDLAICKFRKGMVIHDTECPYWDQVSLNNTNPTLAIRLCLFYIALSVVTKSKVVVLCWTVFCVMVMKFLLLSILFNRLVLLLWLEPSTQWRPAYTWRKKATIHQVTTMQATSKNVVFPDRNHLLTTGADDSILQWSPKRQ